MRKLTPEEREIRDERRRIRRREHYRLNRERTLAVNQAYREKNPELIAKLKKEWAAANKDELLRRLYAKRKADPQIRKVEGAKYRMKRGDDLKRSQREYYERNREQVLIYSKERRLGKLPEIAEQKRTARVRSWLRRAGWSDAELERRIALGCEICGRKLPLGKGGLVFDHDHQHGHVRGLLCEKCNQRLDWAIEYYEEIGCYHQFSLEAVA